MRSLAFLTLVIGLTPLLCAKEEPKDSDDFPRRAFFIQVKSYLYLDPLTASPPGRNRDALDRFAASLHVPTWNTNNQLFILSDNLPVLESRAPTRGRILEGLRCFCETSRGQDRIILYLSGHAFEKSGQAFFAPIEGDPADPKTLVPVAEVYDLLKACKATQRVIVWDVCPRNPERSAVRPGSGPMSLELFLALMKSPAGVQAVISCVPMENSLEYSSPKGEAGKLPGSALFEAMKKAFEDSPTAKTAAHTDPIPIADVFPALEKHLESANQAFGTKQSPKLFGNLSPTLVVPDDREILPSAVVFPGVRSTTAAEVKGILQELELPPPVGGEPSEALPALPFESEVLKAYATDAPLDTILGDVEKYPLRIAVLRALQTMRETGRGAGVKEPKPILVVNSPVSEALKKTVQEAQTPLAVAIAKLEDELALLEAAEKLRAAETRRWQAHYGYTLGQLRMRLALLNEYNLVLGHVRTESLPELPAGSSSWRLTHIEKMSSKKDIQELAESARAAFKDVAALNPGTPWEVLAKRTMLALPGLRWEPAVK